eukprot:jgi/Chrzof1/8334/Cz03g06170.t1
MLDDGTVQVGGVMEGKTVFSRPTLPDYKLITFYDPDSRSQYVPGGKINLQLQQLTGALHHNQLTYGMLYTDQVQRHLACNAIVQCMSILLQLRRSMAAFHLQQQLSTTIVVCHTVQ